MRNNWGFAELVRATTAPPTVVNVAVAFAPKARRGGCLTWFGLAIVAFAFYCVVRF